MTSPHEQKKRKAQGSAVVTANRLGDGAVVYRTLDGDWTTDLAQAAVVLAQDRRMPVVPPPFPYRPNTQCPLVQASDQYSTAMLLA